MTAKPDLRTPDWDALAATVQTIQRAKIARREETKRYQDAESQRRVRARNKAAVGPIPAGFHDLRQQLSTAILEVIAAGGPGADAMVAAVASRMPGTRTHSQAAVSAALRRAAKKFAQTRTRSEQTP